MVSNPDEEAILKIINKDKLSKSELSKNPDMKLHKRVFNSDKIYLILMGDEHIGSKYYDKDLHKGWLDWIHKTKDVYVIGMGDHLECATRDSVGAGIFEQSEILQEQYEEVIKLYQPLAQSGKLLGFHIGNHCERVFKHSGFNLIKTLSNHLGVKYFDIGLVHDFKVGNEHYTMYTTHGHSGSRLPHTKIKSCIDLASMVDVEIYAMAHLHQLSHHVRQFYKIDRRNHTINEGTKHFILTGSYLTHWGSYAMEAGYEMMRKGSPNIKLHAEEHKIRVSLG